MSSLHGLKTPGKGHASTEVSIDPDDMSFGSKLEKFNPQDLNAVEKSARQKQLSIPTSTPAPRPFKDRTNHHLPIVNQEFTPLLKSSKKAASAFVKRFSGFGRNIQLQSPSLANIDDVVSLDQTNLGDVSRLSDDPTTDISIHNPESISAVSNRTQKSAVIHRVLLGKAGNAAAMTLKEQERVLDDIKKENFALKLQIHFLNERMAKMSPEGIDSALRENVDIKVESTTLKTELKKYKKILYDSEMRIQQLENEMLKSSGTRCLLTHGMTSEERRMMENAIADKDQYKQELQLIQERWNERENQSVLDEKDDDNELVNENAELKAEIEKLLSDKKELEYELDRKVGGALVENGDRDELLNDNADLKSEVEKLSKDKRELERELERKASALNEKEYEIEGLQGNTDLKAEIDQFLADKRNLEQELERKAESLKEKDDEIDRLSKDSDLKAEIERLSANNRNLKHELECKVGALREKEDEINRLSKDPEVKAEIEQLLADNRSLEDELERKAGALEEKEDEIELLNEQLNAAGRSYGEPTDQVEIDLRLHNEHLSSEVNQLRQKIAALAHSKSQVDGTVNYQKKDHANLADKVSDLKVEIKEITADRDALVQDVKQLKTKLLWESDCGKQSVTEIKALKTQLDIVIRERDTLTEKILLNNRTLKSLQEELVVTKREQEAAGRVMQLESKEVNTSSPDEGKLDLKRNLHQLESSLKSKEFQIEDLRQQLLTHEQDFHFERQTLTNEWNAKYKRLEHEKSHLREQLLRSRQREAELSKSNIACEDKASELQGKIYLLESQLQDSEAAEQMKRNDFTSQIDHFSSEKEGLRSKISNLTNQMKSLRDKSLHEQRALQREIQRGQHQQSILNTRIETINVELLRTQSERARISEKHHSVLSKFIGIFGEDTSLYLNVGDDIDVLQIERFAKQISTKHQSELRGLVKQIKYLRARFSREEAFRHDLAFSKKFFLLQVASFEACNHANLAIIEQMGIFPERALRDRRPSLRGVVKAVIFVIRTRRLRNEWVVNVQLKQVIAQKLAESRSGRMYRPMEGFD